MERDYGLNDQRFSMPTYRGAEILRSPWWSGGETGSLGTDPGDVYRDVDKTAGDGGRAHEHGSSWRNSTACRLSLCAMTAVLTLAACGQRRPADQAPRRRITSSSSSGGSSSTNDGCITGRYGTVPRLPYHDQTALCRASARPTRHSSPATHADLPQRVCRLQPAGKAPHHRHLGHGPRQPHAGPLIPMLQRAAGSRASARSCSSPLHPPGSPRDSSGSLTHPATREPVVADPLLPQPFIPIAATAKAAGVPFISIFDARRRGTRSTSPRTGSLTRSPPGRRGEAERGRASSSASTGSSTSVDQDDSRVGGGVARCPGLHFDTSVVDQFQPAVARRDAQLPPPPPAAGRRCGADRRPDLGIPQRLPADGPAPPGVVAAGPSSVRSPSSTPTRPLARRSRYAAGCGGRDRVTVSQLIAGRGRKVSGCS